MKKLAIILALVVSASCAAFAQENPQRPTAPLSIVSGDKTHAFNVELADSPEETELGLMYRKEMPRDHGMIFDFGQPRRTGMWMKNCLFPQDMLFLDNDGTILAIAENARPGSLRIIDPGMPVKGVLELNAGVVQALSLKPGDKVRHPNFGSPAATAANAG